MNEWQQNFTSKMHKLRDQVSRKFDVFADETVNPVFEEFSEFAGRCDFRCTTPVSQEGARLFKFGLTEDGYLLTAFRPKGMGEIEFDFECYAPGQGQVESKRSLVTWVDANQEWVRRCFETALDCFVGCFSAQGTAQSRQEEKPQPVHA